MIPLSTAEQVVEPVLSKIFTGRMSLSQATLATPIELLLEAAATPATPVPWFRSSSVAVESIRLVPGNSLDDRSATGDTPLSTIAMTTFGLPMVVSQASGAWIIGRCHSPGYQ